MCVFEGSMPPSISVTREQEVRGEYGIYPAHKHKYLFKIIYKGYLKMPKSGSKYLVETAAETT